MSYSLLWLSIYIKLYLIPMVQTYVLDPMAGDLPGISQTPMHLRPYGWIPMSQTPMRLRQSYTYRSVNYRSYALYVVPCFSDTINLSGDLWCQTLFMY